MSVVAAYREQSRLDIERIGRFIENYLSVFFETESNNAVKKKFVHKFVMTEKDPG